MKVEPTICSPEGRAFAGALVYDERLTVAAPAVLPAGCCRSCKRLGDEGGMA